MWRLWASGFFRAFVSDELGVRLGEHRAGRPTGVHTLAHVFPERAHLGLDTDARRSHRDDARRVCDRSGVLGARRRARIAPCRTFGSRANGSRASGSPASGRPTIRSRSERLPRRGDRDHARDDSDVATRARAPRQRVVDMVRAVSRRDAGAHPGGSHVRATRSRPGARRPMRAHSAMPRLRS